MEEFKPKCHSDADHIKINQRLDDLEVDDINLTERVDTLENRLETLILFLRDSFQKDLDDIRLI